MELAATAAEACKVPQRYCRVSRTSSIAPPQATPALTPINRGKPPTTRAFEDWWKRIETLDADTVVLPPTRSPPRSDPGYRRQRSTTIDKSVLALSERRRIRMLPHRPA